MRNSRIAYEYGSDGKLTKIRTVDYENNQTESFYKNDILTQQSTILHDYEVNSKGFITKITNKTSNGFSTEGQFVRYTFDANGLKTKSENVNAQGKVVNTVTTEYTTFKDQEIGVQDYLKGKGFPTIGPEAQKYYLKKETTFLLNNTTNMLNEHVSFSYDDYKIDSDGKLLNRTFKNNTINPKDDATVILNYNYIGCI